MWQRNRATGLLLALLIATDQLMYSKAEQMHRSLDMLNSTQPADANIQMINCGPECTVKSLNEENDASSNSLPTFLEDNAAVVSEKGSKAWYKKSFNYAWSVIKNNSKTMIVSIALLSYIFWNKITNLFYKLIGKTNTTALSDKQLIEKIKQLNEQQDSRKSSNEEFLFSTNFWLLMAILIVLNVGVGMYLCSYSNEQYYHQKKHSRKHKRSSKKKKRSAKRKHKL